MDVRARRSREASPDRARVYMQPKVKMLKKVQIVYYLCRNGQLEHPHFMEVSHLASQQLRLKDVVDRLTVLRGRGMPSLFSWSCKRSYKNGYVWNDLSENDAIYPVEGLEYVLKGSEILEGCAERFQQLQLNIRSQNPEPIFHPKRKLLLTQPRKTESEEEPADEEEEKLSNSSTNTLFSRCSRGVSTEEIEESEKPKTRTSPTELALEDDGGSPPSSSSTISEKAQTDSNRFDDDPEPGVLSRNSVLLQLIACGSGSARKSAGSGSVARAVNGSSGRKSSSLHKGVVCKTAKSLEEEEIHYMSENPRFGNLQSEEKEYFSGSIVESMTENRPAVESSLKKSSSYNEERSQKGLGEAAAEAEKAEKMGGSGSGSSSGSGSGVKGKCIPRKRHPKN